MDRLKKQILAEKEQVALILGSSTKDQEVRTMAAEVARLITDKEGGEAEL